ncbi:MAG: NUDIX hydrolase [Halofilum sp. (in: g-proteobacteria)]|nr:NUDIX hydrolase [Halofilum sp. (in: g-proteobacteria)]
MTVAAVIEREGRFLVVEEVADGSRVFNQPAGHLEPGEPLLDAVIREVREETGTRFRPEAVVGVYRWVNPASGETHVRIAFSGRIEEDDDDPELDEPIIARHWLSYDDLTARPERLRSPLVLGCIDDYRDGACYPLDLLRDLEA